MPKFIYKAKQGPDQIVKGVIEADDINSAVAKIAKLGYTPLAVSPASEVQAKTQSRTSMASINLFKRISLAQIAFFTRQMYDLVDANVPLLRGLRIILNQTKSVQLKSIISDMYNVVEDGGTFSSALARHKNIFSPMYINMVKSGEIGGNLAIVLKRLAEFAEKDQEIRSKVTSSLVYPVFILIVGAVVITALMIFAIPQLTVMFEDMDQGLPLPTKILIGISDMFIHFWWLMLAGIGAVVVYINTLKNTVKGKLWLDAFTLSVPVLGDFIRDVEIGRFARSLGTLLDSGVVIVTALDAVRDVLTNAVLKKEISFVALEVKKGTSLTKAMGKCSVIPESTVSIIAIGEETGELEKGLFKLADLHERRSSAWIKVMMSLVEPALIFVIACIVLFMVIALLLPIINMNLAI